MSEPSDPAAVPTFDRLARYDTSALLVDPGGGRPLEALAKAYADGTAMTPRERARIITAMQTSGFLADLAEPNRPAPTPPTSSVGEGPNYLDPKWTPAELWRARQNGSIR